MQAGQLRSSVASVLAFGHMMGLRHSNRHHKPRATPKHIEIREPSMGAAELGVTFESDPVLYRALHPIWGRGMAKEAELKPSKAEPVQTIAEPAHSVRAVFEPITRWTWEI